MNVTNLDFNSIVNTALQGAGIEGLDNIQLDATEDADGNLTISFTGADGKVYTFSAEVPELDEATGEPTPEAMAALEAKLEAEFEQMSNQVEETRQLLAETNAEELPSEIKGLLFDIYALMNLMLEIAQKQREAARTERKADLDRSVQDIKNQAEIQRKAARLSMILGICTTVASVATQVLATGMSAKASRAAQQMEKNAGATQINADLKILTADTPKATQANLNEIQTKMGTTGVQEVKVANEAMMEKAAALNEPKTAYDAAVRNREQYALKTANLLDTYGGREGVLDAQTKKISGLDSEVKTLEQQLETTPEGPEKTKLESRLAEKQEALKNAKEEMTALEARFSDNDPTLKQLDEAIETSKASLETAQNEFEQAADDSLTRVDGKLATARSELLDLEAASPQDEAKIQSKKEEVEKLEQEHTWIRSYATDVKINSGMGKSLTNDIKGCEKILGQKMDELKLDAQYRQYQSSAEKYASMRGMIDQVGRMISDVVRLAGDMQSAEATEKQAEAKIHENMQSESEDLSQSALQLLKSVLDLLRQVIEAENQSIRQIVA